MLPQSGDWNSFWKNQATGNPTAISWSKRRMLKLLSLYTKPGMTALDAGCGSGFFSRFFCNQDLHTIALDYAPSALEMARTATNGRAELLQIDLIKDDLGQRLGARADIIFSDGLLEHFTDENQSAILQNLKKALKDTGLIVTFVPNRWSPWELIRPFYMPGIEERPFTLGGLNRLHERQGLKIIASGGVNTLPFRVSPEGPVAALFGMLLYVIAQKE
ncbi:MAG: class I SAM-dependent methyltransferase [Candidatus Omnitrophica bacterium]|nr:class I SAM-dependent methyltransferase [Candidatus Omnitrophota bacterium]